MTFQVKLIAVILATSLSSQAATVAIEGRLADAATGPTDFGDKSSNGHFNAIGADAGATDGTASITLSATGSVARWSTSYGSGNGDYNAGEEWNVYNNNNSGLIDGVGGAIEKNAFLAITVTSTSPMDLTSLSVSIWRNGSGAPDLYQFAYSADDTWDSSDLLGTATTNNTDSTANGFDVSETSDLPTGVTTANFRLYYAGTANVSGNFHVYNVAAGYDVVPEPSSALLGMLGALALLRRKR